MSSLPARLKDAEGWRQWFAYEPPERSLLRFEYALTGQMLTCRPEDIPGHWDRRLLLWKRTGIARREEANG